jgi:hypothetical protein
MIDRVTRAQHDGSESEFVGDRRRMANLSSRTWRRIGVVVALASLGVACGGDDSNPTGSGAGATGGATGSGGSGAAGKGGATTAGAGGASGTSGGSSGSGGSAGAATGGAAGKAGAGGSSGTGGAAGSGGAGGSKDAGAGTGGGGGSPDGGTPDATPDISMPPGDAGGDTIGGNLTVVTVDPVARGFQAAVTAPITITFDRPVDRASVTNKSLWAYGRWSGPVRPAMYTFSNSDKTVSFAPARNWPAGDRVTVVLSHDLAGADATKLRSQGYSYQYTTAAKAANQMYTEVQRLTSRTTTTTTTRTYGGSVADLNNDGYLDLMTINEDSADMRIFMNKGAAATATSVYNPFVAPPTKVGNRASPSETTDFNGDGVVDIVVANLNDDTLSILFGNNNGTFTLSQTPAVGGQPRGVAVLDVDGDGDIDIVNTNADGDNMSLLKNDGTGKFPTTQSTDGGPGIVFFDSAFGMGTASQEFGLMSGDMNEDGILDIVIGARGIMGNNRATVVNLGTGNGSFAFGSLQAPTTSGWQLVVGDMNGDGHEDVATADSDLATTLSLNTVSVLLGDGKGKVNLQQTYSGGLNRPFAIDLGDIDGDKDLDLVVSNYSGNWQVLLNDGTSKVTAGQTWTPAQSASCALLIDIDNDQDLDLVVVDEEEDQVVVLRQSP